VGFRPRGMGRIEGNAQSVDDSFVCFFCLGPWSIQTRPLALLLFRLLGAAFRTLLSIFLFPTATPLSLLSLLSFFSILFIFLLMRLFPHKTRQQLTFSLPPPPWKNIHKKLRDPNP